MLINAITISAVVFAGSAAAQLYPILNENHTCAIQPAYRSCSSKAVPENVDSCCVETFGGLVLETQVNLKSPVTIEWMLTWLAVLEHLE